MHHHEFGRWYAAKASGREGRARLDMNRRGLTSFVPERHIYFVDKRTNVEKVRKASLIPGYVFFFAASPEQIARASNSLGVSYVLGEWSGDSFRPSPMPKSWIERLMEAGPVIEGKRKKFCNGDKVRAIISGLTSIVGTVERHKGGKVSVRAEILGASRVVMVDASKVEVLS